MKKDLKAAAARGADLFFSATDAQDAQKMQEIQDVQNVIHPHKAQDEQPAQLVETIQEMQAAIEADEQRRQERKQRKADEKHVNICLSKASYDYCKTMGGITGKGMTRFIAELIEREAATNNDLYNRAKEILNDAQR